MSKLLCFSIYDKKATVHMSPVFVPNTVTALRSVAATLTEKNNLSMYPGDFALYELGYFDQDSGLIISNGNPVFVEELQNLMPKELKQNG